MTRAPGSLPLYCLLIQCLFGLLSGCAQPSSWPDTATSSKTTSFSNASRETNDWPTYGDAGAQAYTAECRHQYSEALAQLHLTEKKHFSDHQNLLAAINQLDTLINGPLGRAGLYANVHPNADMRAAGDVCEQKMLSLENDILNSSALYQKISRVPLADLNDIERAFANRRLEQAKLYGAHLPPKEREHLRQLNEAIVKTGQVFLANMRNHVQQLEFTQEELQGLPQDFFVAHAPNAQGRVVLTTAYPEYLPVMMYAHNDSARLRMYQAYRQRGYPENREVLKKLLMLRHEYARVLGFDHFADYITADKMVGSAQAAAEFIDRIHTVSKPRAQRDYARLLQRLHKIDPGAISVGDWQKTYLEDLIKQEDYALDTQELRRYFSYDKVRKGIFELTESLFQVSIRPWQTEVWHDSVEAYEIWEQGRLLGQFYLDMQPREGKYQHAAHFTIRYGAAPSTPLAALVANFPIGEGNTGLLEHDHVETFLHEFGHLLHGMFGGQLPWVSLAGTNVQRDFVEAPSMMLEEWVWDRDTLRTFATDENGKVIPDALITRMNAARKFGKGIFTHQQLFYAALSLNYYNRDPKGLDLDAVAQSLQRQYSPFAYVPETYFYAGFTHLDGYSATYYTYMWSQAIATDMFSEFQRAGLRNSSVAKRYRNTVLAPGASKPAAQLVEDFLGRPFSVDAFAGSLETE